MYIDSNHLIYISVIVVLLFIIPIFVKAYQNSLLKSLTFNNFVRVLNKSLLIQIIVGIILLPTMFILDKQFYRNSDGNILTDLVINVGFCYIVIGVFYYIPGIIILNIIKFWINKIRGKNYGKI